jgi:hypothetical protein
MKNLSSVLLTIFVFGSVLTELDVKAKEIDFTHSSTEESLLLSQNYSKQDSNLESELLSIRLHRE